jgi:hypothetical protein
VIETATASAQILRLAGLKFFPRGDKVALEELTSALSQSARTNEHARKIIDDWLHDSSEVPTPAAIYELGAATAPAETSECDLCDSTGFRRVYQLVEYEGKRSRSRVIQPGDIDQERRSLTGDQVIIEAVQPCSCRRKSSAA